MPSPNDLGLLSEVASFQIPQRLIDPQLLPPESPSTDLALDQGIAQHGQRDPLSVTTRGTGGGGGDISVDGTISHAQGGLSGMDLDDDSNIDPSLRNLSKDNSPFDQRFLFDSPYLPTGSQFSRQQSEAVADDEEEEEEEEEGEESDYSLEPTPEDPTEQVNQLREMDEEATNSLIKNREYQEELKTLMARFESANKRTNELKAFVKSLSAELLADSEMKIVAPGTVEPALPWFKHHYGRDLPPNEEGIERDLYLETTRFWPWSIAERIKLKQEVVTFNQRKVAMEQALDMGNEGEGGDEDGVDLAERLKEIDENWYVENTEGIDWDSIALVIKRRTPMACKLQWLQHDHPLLNFKKFSKDEMARLIEMVEEKGMKDWEEIAKELGNGRVGWDCLRKYRTRPGQRIDWTPEQDDKLRSAVKIYGENWQIVARLVGKHSNACINRWTKSLRPTITRGKWSQQEDDALKTAVALVGKNWREVAPRVSGRTDAQCRERWTNVMDPSLSRKKPWTPEEDRELLEAIEAGKTWAQVSRELFNGSRTDNKCMRRYQDLQKKPKGKSKKGKKKYQPKETDEEDNAMSGGEGNNDGSGAGEGSSAPPPKKRSRREVKKKNPGLSELLARDGEEEGEEGDIRVDLDIFATDQELGLVGDPAAANGATGESSGSGAAGAGEENGVEEGNENGKKGKAKRKAPARKPAGATKRGRGK